MRTTGTLIPFRPRPRPAEAPLPDDLPALVSRASEGLVWAKAALFRRFAPELLRLLGRLLGSTLDAEDAVQDAFVVAFTELPQLRDPAAFPGWLRQIAVRQAHRRFRKRRLLRALGLDSRTPQDASLAQLAATDAAPDLRAELRLLDGALQRLPTAERMAWMLRHVEGLELTEVASACGCSLATAKRRIAAAQEGVRVHVAVEDEHG